jgi:hypothetical protein
MHARSIAVLALIVFAAACSGPPSEPGPALSSEGRTDWPQRAVVHWSSFLVWDEEKIAEASRAGIVVFPMECCFSPLAGDIIGSLRDRNPEIRIIGYHYVLAVPINYPDTTYLRNTYPYVLDYYNLVRDNWAWTTTGDTLMIWPETILLDPIDGPGPDMALLESIAGLIARYADEYPEAIDGIMHDYFMYRPFISPYLNGSVEGDIDLDGNGILIGDDESERELFLRWQKDYAGRLRELMGPDFIQVGNGRVVQEDPELAGILNGIFYELFPNMCWSLTDRDGMLKLLSNQGEGWLAMAHGRTWSILTNESIEYNNAFCLLAGLLAGCFHAELHGAYLFDGWSDGIDAGRPLSDVEIEGSPDSVMTIRRSFRGGEARIRFGSHGGRTEAVFVENGSVVR